MLIIVVLLAAISAYILAQFVGVFIRNQKAFKFFSSKCPHLPTVPNPSPFSGHLTRLIMTDMSWKLITQLHTKYGTNFGLYYVDQPWLATKDLDLIKLIEIDEAKKHPNRAFLGGPLKHFNESIFQIDGEDWRATRQVLAPALSNFNVKGEEISTKIDHVTREFVRSLEKKLQANRQKTGENHVEFEIRDAFERLALAVIFLVSYNQANVIDFETERDRWTELFARGARDATSPLVYASMMFPFLRPALSFLSRFSPFGIWERSIVRHIKLALDAKRPTISDRSSKTVLDTAIDGYLAKRYSYEHFLSSLLFLTMAGAVTTADSLSCLVWQLAMNQHIQDKLRHSLREEGINSRYLSWCINETIRWHPAVPLGVGRILGEDVSVNGQTIPRGTFVMPSTHSIHHDPNIWPDPEQFDPDRWRDEAKFHPAAFVGFGLGPRNCLGRYLAVHEIKHTIKALLDEYKIEPCARTPDEWRFHVPAMLYTIMDEPVVVRLTPLS